MLTSRTSIALPGTLEPNRRVIALVGLHPDDQGVLPSSSVMVASNGRCGARLNTRAISVTLRPRRFPVRR